MKKKLSIKSSIVIVISAAIIAVLACQLIFSIFFSKSYFIYTKKNEIQNLFYYIKSNYSDDLQELTNSDVINDDGFNYNIIIFNDSDIIFRNRFGGITATIPNGGIAAAITNEGMRTQFFPAGYFGEFTEEPLAVVIEIDELNVGNIQLTGKFTYNEENYYVLIQMPVQSIEDSVAVISSANAVISACILILGIIGALLFSTRFSKPIRHIQNVAHSVSEFDFSHKADENIFTKELNNLAISINVMSDKLNGLIADLREKNEKLNRDIDYQKKLDVMRRTFIANVSHEFKTPLCLLQLYSENLKNASLNIDREYYCDTIISEVASLDVMVKSMLELSLVENGLTKMTFLRFDMSGFTRQLVQKMLPLFNGITCEIYIEEELFINGDAYYVEQAYKNIITNAISHTRENGSVKLRLYLNGEAVRFSVYNTGDKIPEDDIGLIWDSFYKSDKSRVRENGSVHAGLGLYIVKTIVEAHGGAYGVFNTENGVEFWVDL